MTTNTKTSKYRIPADQLQNLEIDRNGRVTPRLHDLDPLQNTLLSVLYPGIKVASMNVPAEPLDDYEESQVENALARLVWNGIHYKLVGASGSSKDGKFYFVDTDHSRAIAERFQHWPQAAIVYFGILVSDCKVVIKEPDVSVLVVEDHVLGTNDCSGWIVDSLVSKLELPENRFYQFRLAFDKTQAKGAFKTVGKDVAPLLGADIVLPESAVKPGL